jgi:uncharacterized protein YcnI
MTSMIHRGAVAATALALSSTLALAHATLGVTQSAPNATYRGIVQINHGCGEAPTTRVSVTIPEGVIGARPMPKPGWTLATTKGPYAKAYPYFHADLTEGVKTITWSGGALPGDQFDEFVFVARITDTFQPGQTVYFPIEQDCATGGYKWVQIPAAGQDAHALKEPAPGVRIVAAAAVAAPTVMAGPIAIQAPWLRATPGGAKVAGGYLRVTNNGREPDRLLDAAIPISTRGEVHQMSTENGIMKMAPVDGGLEIKPGESVELKPGGYHLMFMGLTGALKEGDTVKGSLDFAKAGRVEVTFRVGGIGAQGPAAPGGEEHVH